ncbi:hypothetical protein FXF14_02955 [Vibrio cholerae]|nr:hypothetical protein FXF14_02955 [Vibrio cholerae]
MASSERFSYVRTSTLLPLANLALGILLPTKPPITYNARLRGWQRITTKLKHTNRNHYSSLGLETPRVDSPS